MIAFAAFLRFDELAKLVRSDVEIKSDMLKLFIESSKTDHCRDGPWVVIASSGKQLNIFNIQIEYTALKNRQTLSRPKPWCNDSGVLFTPRLLHHDNDVKEVVASQPIVTW